MNGSAAAQHAAAASSGGGGGGLAAAFLPKAIDPLLQPITNATGAAGVQCSSGNWSCIDTYKVDSQIYLSMITSGIVGAACLIGFCWLQSFVSVYRGRLLSPQVAIKPPVYTGNGIAKYFHWFWVTISLSEKELLATAGMDALMFERLIVLCIQFITPVTIISCAALLPIHATSTFLKNTSSHIRTSDLMQLTMSNVSPGARTMWVHFALVWLYCLYAMWLLNQHYKWYVLLRQQYLARGDSVCTWLGHTPQQQLPARCDSTVLLPASSTHEQLLNPHWTFARCRPSDMGEQQQQQQQGGAVAGASGDGGMQAAAAAAGERRTSRATLLELDSMVVRAAQQPGQQQKDVQLVPVCHQPEPLGASTADSSPADSRLTSRQSSTRALLPPGAKLHSSSSSSQHANGSGGLREPLQPQQQQQQKGHHAGSKTDKQQQQDGGRRGSWGLFRGRHAAATGQQQHGKHANTVPGENGTAGSSGGGMRSPFASDGAQGFDELSDAEQGGSGGTASPPPASRSSSCWGFGARQRRTQRSSSASLTAEELAQQQRRQQQQQRRQQAAEAAAMLGADLEWWAFKTGDPLLDRHVVDVDVATDSAWASDPGADGEQQPPQRLNRWWEIAPPDAPPTLDGTPGGGQQGGSNLSAVPGTSLLFDRRSLRARKPSVRFRNTLHVRGLQGGVVPLHVAGYAVLVTDVPGCGSDGGDDCDGGHPCRRRRPTSLLDRLLQALFWSWPCLLSPSDVLDITRSWGSRDAACGDASRTALLPHMQQQLLLQEQLGKLPPVGAGPAAALGLAPDPAAAAAAAIALPPQQHMHQPHGRAALGSELGPPPGGSRPDSCDSGSSGASSSNSAGGGRPAPGCASRRQQLVETTFRELFKEDFHAVVPVRNFRVVDELLRKWNAEQQAYIQARALLQLRLVRRVNKAAAAAARASGGAAMDAGGRLRPLRHRRHARDAATAAALAAEEGSSAAAVAAPAAAAQPARVATLQRHASVASSVLEAYTSGVLSSCGPDEPCRTGQLAPLTPQPPGTDVAAAAQAAEAQAARRGCCGLSCACCGGARRQGDGGDNKAHIDGGALQAAAAGGADSGSEGDEGSVAEALEAKRQELADMEAAILEAQQEVLAAPDTGAFFVLFKSPRAATLAARSSVFPHSSSFREAFKVQPAPGPEDVLWQTLWKSRTKRHQESLRSLLWYAVFYLVPTGIFTAALNSISYGLCNTPDLGVRLAWFCKTRFLQFLFTVVLPFVLLMVWQNAIIPANFYKLELRRGSAVSLSQMEGHILLVYVGWELVNLFLGGVLSASLTSQIKILIEHPDQWAIVLGAAFPNSSNFFLNYVIARAFMMNLFRLVMPHGGMWRWVGQMLFSAGTSLRHAATQRYRAFIIYPASIRYGREPGLVLLIFLLGVAYCVAAPLITPFVLAYMGTAYLLWRYQMLYVCVRAYEGGGTMWPVYFLCLNWCVGLFVVFTSSMFIFKQANIQGVLILPLLPTLYLFSRWCRFKYARRVEAAPLWLAHEAPRTEIDPLVYTPAALQPHAQGWYFELGKGWVRWGVPPYI